MLNHTCNFYFFCRRNLLCWATSLRLFAIINKICRWPLCLLIIEERPRQHLLYTTGSFDRPVMGELTKKRKSILWLLKGALTHASLGRTLLILECLWTFLSVPLWYVSPYRHRSNLCWPKAYWKFVWQGCKALPRLCCVPFFFNLITNLL